MPSRWQVPPVMMIGEVKYLPENRLQQKDKTKILGSSKEIKERPFFLLS